MKKLKVAVLMGGRGSEREISMMSGKEVMKNLDKERYEVKKVEMGEMGWVKKLNEVEIVFITMHGKYGEDGRIQGMLDCLGVKYTGSGVRASVVGMDKGIFRRLMESEKILMPKLTRKVPCVVKPTDQGSSVGVSIVKRRGDLEKAIKLAEKYSNEVIVEEYIEGVEVSCGVLGDEALPVIEIHPKNDFFDYEAKYTMGKCEEIVPARLDREITGRVQEIALKVFKIVGCKGFARIDMIIKGKEVYVLEINTIPGFTAQSLLPKEALAAGISYSQLLDRILILASEEP